MNYREEETIPKEIVDEVHTLVLENAQEIAENMFQPSGLWFFMQKDANGKASFSDLLTQNTHLNPENYNKGEWVISFRCTEDLDDVPAGEEVEVLSEMISCIWTEDDIRQKISFPAGP